MDAIELEVLWASLVNTVNEQAKALQRSAFSPIVREAGDLANALFDREGRMVAQAVTGTPGHINSLAVAARNILDEYPRDRIEPGDVLVTNDPYKTAGQLLDVTVLSPVWYHDEVIGYFGSTIHHTDVGGYGIGAGARDVFEEGLWIPITKLMTRGERSPDVWRFILANVREPEHMAGDLHAQVASGEIGAARLRRALRRPRPRRHRSTQRGSAKAFRRGDPERDPRPSRGSLRGAIGPRPRRRQRDRDPSRRHRRLHARIHRRRLHGLVGREPLRHQRRQELHARVLDLHDPQRAQPRSAEQRRESPTDRRHCPRGQHRQRGVSGTMHGAARRRDVPPDAAADRARPESCPRPSSPRARRRSGRCRSRARTPTAGPS